MIRKIAIAGVIYFLFSIGYYFGSRSQKQPEIISPNTTELPTIEPTPEPTPYKINKNRDIFIDACSETAGDIRFCECIYDELITIYGEDNLQEVADNYAKTGDYPDEVLDAVLRCEE